MSFVDPIYEEEPGIQDITGLCISGGGYRATLFHLGSLWRINQTGHLQKIQRISSVSGGSITTAWLGCQWKNLVWENGVAKNFKELVVEPVRAMARVSIDVGSVLGGMFSLFSTAGNKVAKAYDKHLFKGATLQHFPDSQNGEGPRFVVNATNLQSGANWRFSRRYMGDYKVGLIKAPNIPLATAVAASSAFPPFLSPVKLDLTDFEFAINQKVKFLDGEFRRTAILSDGGVYDNMGMETVWKRCRTLLISDAGAAFSHEAEIDSDWPRHSIRVMGVIDNQVRSLRRREIIREFKSGQTHRGAYWSMRNTPVSFTEPPPPGTVDPAITAAVMAQVAALPFDLDRATALALTPTRLASMDDRLQEGLINLGYIISTAALATYAPGPIGTAPVSWPYAPGLGV